MAHERIAARSTGVLFLDMALAAQEALLETSLAVVGGGRRPGTLPARGATRAEEVIPLGEEVLNVEARRVIGNTTRVRRFVVEQPVERRVVLRDERVVVERRRPVVTDEAGDTLTEKTVEATETTEVPVVWKGVRLKEEVVLRLEASERTEIVRETVRRDEVEIEQPRRAATAAAPAAAALTAAGGRQHNDNAEALTRREPKAG
jgi:stress response protein YsnF